MRTADVKLFVRNLFRNKLYSGITVLGFAMALTFVVLLTVYIRQELSVDVFHAHKDRIVRLASEKGSGYSGPMAAMLKEQFPEVEDYCLFMTNKDGLAAVSPTEKIRYTYAYVSPSFFRCFLFRWYREIRMKCCKGVTVWLFLRHWRINCMEMNRLSVKKSRLPE